MEEAQLKRKADLLAAGEKANKELDANDIKVLGKKREEVLQWEEGRLWFTRSECLAEWQRCRALAHPSPCTSAMKNEVPILPGTFEVQQRCSSWAFYEF